jgi:DNA-binding NarL/FixJ family response regulator
MREIPEPIFCAVPLRHAASSEDKTMTNRPRILIADDHTLVAELCKKLLETEFDVIGTVCDGRALVRAVVELQPDLVVVDVGMPILNGLDAGQQVKEILPAVKLVYLTMNSDVDVAAEAFERGASGYLLKTCSAAEMVAAVRDVLQGKSYISRGLSRDEIDYFRCQKKKPAAEDERLTSRQREVLQLLAEGKVMKQVGCILNLSTRTVGFHKYRLKKVLGAKNDAELVKYAVRNHLIAA